MSFAGILQESPVGELPQSQFQPVASHHQKCQGAPQHLPLSSSRPKIYRCASHQSDGDLSVSRGRRREFSRRQAFEYTTYQNKEHRLSHIPLPQVPSEACRLKRGRAPQSVSIPSGHGRLHTSPPSQQVAPVQCKCCSSPSHGGYVVLAFGGPIG